MLTFTDFQSRARLARERAERIRSARHAAMRRALQASGLGADAGLNVLHNALLSFENGKPWPEVNYSAARLARRLEALAFEPGRIADAYTDRLWRQVSREGRS